ncbi:hypothetical protein HanXRQr2_Chr10g0431761 [Helianthus annuus]|nr:hypothetical protein HanXRQr2_Chr10g0431761 [Helianthus annuus]
MNPSVVDEEEGLPSPPLDDLAFLNPHSMSLELSEFFDGGMIMEVNAQKNENHNNRKPPVEKQNVTKWKPHKPLNRETMVPNRTVVKPVNNQLIFAGHGHHHLNQGTPYQHGATRVPPGKQRVADMVQLPGSRLPDCTHTCGSCSRRENHVLFNFTMH